MKPCLICHHDNANDASTCPKCGEASWGAVARAEAPKKAPVPLPIADDQSAASALPAPADAQAGARNKRRSK